MLVEQAQVGCILGKGGETISDLRRSTGASIRVVDRRDLPSCAGKADALVAVSHPLGLCEYACLTPPSPLSSAFSPE
jgi:poly(rC)-binding protein 2/3/4